MRADIVTNDSGELVRREHARELGASVVVAIYRLAKLAQMHDLGNQALARQLEQTAQSIADYCLRAGTNVNVLFADKAIFVAGQLLKGSRATYESAAELGTILERLGGSELFLHRDVTREDLAGFVEQIAVGHRSAPGSFRELTPKIRLRPVTEAARMRGLDVEPLSADQKIVRTYASAVVVMRRFYEDLAAGRYVLPRRIKRIAQSLVDLSSGATPSFLGVTEVRNANFDEAGRAVNTAIVAVSMVREATSDRTTLAQVAMAAMMHDVARPRALARASEGEPDLPGMAGPSTLSEDQEDRLPAGAAAVLTALGRVNEPSMRRTVLTFEALWIRREAWLGRPYGEGESTTVHARVIAVARRYNDLLTPEPGLAPRTPDQAIAALAEELKDAEGRTVLRMLLAALDLLPKGTEVVLATGEIAEVVRGPRRTGDSARVRIVRDAQGNEPDAAIELELADDPARSVTRIKSVDGWKRDAPIEAPPEDTAGEAEPLELEAIDEPAPLPSAFGPHVEPEEEEEPPPSSVETEDLDAFTADAIGGDDVPAPQESQTALVAAESAPELEAISDVPRPEEPTALGDLGSTPLPHVLVYMLDHALTGSVVFEGDEGEDIVHFVDGVPTKVRLREPVARLGHVLRDSGAIDEAALEEAALGAESVGILLGEFLVGDDLVTEEQLTRALEVQLLRSVAHLANLPAGHRYAFYEHTDLLAGWTKRRSATTTPLSPILAAVRSWSDRSRIHSTLDRIGAHPLVIHPEADVERLVLLPEEARVIACLTSSPVTLEALRARDVADAETIASVVYALAVTRQFAFKGQRKAPMAAKPLAVASLVPVETDEPAEPSARRFADRSKAKARPQIRPISPAVKPPGSTRALAPQIRPVGASPPRKVTPAPASKPGPDAHSMLFGRMPDGQADDDQATARAAAHFREAEAALLRGDLVFAQRAARRAVEDDPLKSDHYALLAWIQALRSPDDALGEAIATMTDLLNDEPESSRLLHYRATLLARSGSSSEARADLEKLLSIDPTHPTAGAELRRLS